MKIAIFAIMYEFNPQYSLSTVVRDRYEILTKAGHSCEVWVQEDFRGDNYGMICKPVIPRFMFHDYQTGELLEEHKEIVAQIRDMIVGRLLTGIEAIFMEDVMFQGWYYPHNLAVREAAIKFPQVKFFNVCHSIPAGQKTIWTTPPPNVKLISLNETIKMHVAENYHTTLGQVRVIYNSMDFRTFQPRNPRAVEIYERFKLMEADIVQIYPYSTERWRDKGVDKLMKIFSGLKRLGNNVRLVLCTGWHFPEEVVKTREMAEEAGLTPEECIITSEAFTDQMGTPNDAVRQLMQISDIFIFPTRAECCPLILLEAMMSGCYVYVNDMLPQLIEFAGAEAMSSHLNDSIFHGHTVDNEDKYYDMIAMLADAELRNNRLCQTKRRIRKLFNFEYLYKTQYLPVLMESITTPYTLKPIVHRTTLRPKVEVVSSEKVFEEMPKFSVVNLPVIEKIAKDLEGGLIPCPGPRLDLVPQSLPPTVINIDMAGNAPESLM
jgi:glycosyltransferase involved in cell wall biosynthesis